MSYLQRALETDTFREINKGQVFEENKQTCPECNGTGQIIF